VEPPECNEADLKAVQILSHSHVTVPHFPL